MNTGWEKIIGHKVLIQQLQTMLQEDRVPHAMLFCGMEGVGKSLTAEALAAVLLCHKPIKGSSCGSCPACTGLRNGTHPDFFRLAPESTTKAAKSIKIEAVRELQSSIARKPILSERRVVLIQDADKMNEAAANCLLKTIEEPMGQVVFILLTSSPMSMLDTVLSRCMRIEFGALEQSELLEILARHGIEGLQASQLASFADGSASQALALQDGELMDLHKSALELIGSIQQMDVQGMLDMAKQYAGRDREQLMRWLSFLAMLYRDLLVLYSGSELPLYNQADLHRLSALLLQYPQPRLLKLLQLTREYQKRLNSNVNIQLTLEGFLIRMKELMEE